MQSLLSSLAMRFSDTAFFQKLIWGLLSDLDEVIHNQSAARRPEALQAMLPCCRSAIFKQPGLLNLHSRVAPVSQIFTSNSGRNAEIVGKLQQLLQTQLQAQLIISEWREDLIRLLLVTLLFIACPRLMSLLISLSTPNTFLCPCRDLRSRESGPGVNARRAWPGGH